MNFRTVKKTYGMRAMYGLCAHSHGKLRSIIHVRGKQRKIECVRVRTCVDGYTRALVSLLHIATVRDTIRRRFGEEIILCGAERRDGAINRARERLKCISYTPGRCGARPDGWICAREFRSAKLRVNSATR